jgi:hypothetical protein
MHQTFKIHILHSMAQVGPPGVMIQSGSRGKKIHQPVVARNGVVSAVDSRVSWDRWLVTQVTQVKHSDMT